MLTASLVGVGDQELVVESRLWHRTVLPRRRVRGLVLQPPLDARERDQLHRRIYAYAEHHDRIWLANGDELTGRLAALPADHGTDLFGLEVLYFQLPSAAEPMVIQTQNVIAVALAEESPAASRPEGNSAYVAFRDGTCLEALDSGRSRWTNCAPTEWRPVARRRRQSVFRSDNARPAVALGHRLSVRSEAGILSTCSATGCQLAIRSRSERLRGAAAQRWARLPPRFGNAQHVSRRVRIERRVPLFAAELALDEETGRDGSVIYRVFLESVANGQAATWRLAYESPIVRGGSHSSFHERRRAERATHCARRRFRGPR